MAGTPALSLAQTITLHVTARLCDDVVDDSGAGVSPRYFACRCGAGANGLADLLRASLSFAGRGAGASWDRLGWVLGPSGGTWGPGRRHRAKQVDAVAGIEGDARVGVAQRVVVQDRDRAQPGGQGASPSVWPTAGEPWPMVTSTTW